MTETPEYKGLAVAASLRSHQREWFAELRSAVLDGEPYVLAHPTAPHEIFEALDLRCVVDAWYSGLVAAKRQSEYYAQVFEENGYHSGLGRYVSMPFAVALDEGRGEAPWGGLPKPALVVSVAGERSASAMARFSGVPEVSIHSPSLETPYPRWWEQSRWQWEDLDGSNRIDFIVEQYQHLISVAEKIAGKKLDLDRLREIMDRVNRQEEYFDRARQLICDAPKLPVRLGEATSQVMGIQWHRGTEWALAQAKAFYEELEQRVANEQWVCPDEKHRLMWLGTGLWQNQGFLNSFEADYSTVFARSNYLSIASDGYIRYGLRDPLRALASRYVTMSEQMHMPGLGSEWALWEADQHRIDGAVLVGQWWWGSQMIAHDLEARGIPVMTLDASSIGGSGWDEEELRASVATFITDRVSRARPQYTRRSS